MTLEEFDRGEIEKGEEYGKGFAERLKEELLQNGLQCGFNGSKWYSLYEIEKFAKKLKKLLTNRKQCDIINTESEGNIMKIVGKKRVGISLTGVWYCDVCNKAYHSTTLANITQKNKKICDKCLDKYKKM